MNSSYATYKSSLLWLSQLWIFSNKMSDNALTYDLTMSKYKSANKLDLLQKKLVKFST